MKIYSIFAPENLMYFKDEKMLFGRASESFLTLGKEQELEFQNKFKI
ncbi:hypothetical protein [Capnocytophaga stomatis]|nr:hypothetical protein [Capnocytophaga stomatis]